MRDEWLELLELRKMAVRRHGDMGAAPPMPSAAESQSERTGNERRRGKPGASLSRRQALRRIHTLQYKTREHYDNLLKRLLDDCREKNLADLNAQNHRASLMMAGRRTTKSRWVTGDDSDPSYSDQLTALTILEDGECARI